MYIPKIIGPAKGSEETALIEQVPKRFFPRLPIQEMIETITTENPVKLKKINLEEEKKIKKRIIM